MRERDGTSEGTPYVGWDIGGAHVKACRVARGRVQAVRQWACPLWQGLDQLDAVLQAAQQHWPDLARVHHAVTMSGEMVDAFAHREEGVMAIAQRMAALPGQSLRFYAGEAGWPALETLRPAWQAVASANWLATAAVAARAVGSGLLVDIGSTTTDIIALQGGDVRALGRTDASRLATGELVYLGVARTPVCVLARQVPFDGLLRNVMNEFFATTADVYRLTGELQAVHDQYPAADGGAKDLDGSCQRLARLIGLDGRDADLPAWRALAHTWRQAQLDWTAEQVDRVSRQAGLPADAPLVAAGCGQFLVEALGRMMNRPVHRLNTVAFSMASDATPDTAPWADVCAPSVAVACLCAQEDAACGS